MYRYLLFAVCFSLAGYMGLLSKPGLDFDSDRVHLIDEINGSYFLEVMNLILEMRKTEGSPTPN